MRMANDLFAKYQEIASKQAIPLWPSPMLNCLYNALFNGYALNPLSPHDA